MYIVKQGLNKKEVAQVKYILSEVIDLYGDFYITKDNVRIALRDNPEVLFDYLQKGDRLAYEVDGEKGIALVTGWSDKANRKYVKVLTKDMDLANALLKVINWQVKIDLYAKVKKNNPIAKVFQRNGYKFMGDRGSEILLKRTYIPRPEKKYEKDIKGE